MDLGYEQLKALKILRDKPGIEASALANQADCSWDELIFLGQKGLIIYDDKLSSMITEAGRREIVQAELDDII